MILMGSTFFSHIFDKMNVCDFATIFMFDRNIITLLQKDSLIMFFLIFVGEGKYFCMT